MSGLSLSPSPLISRSSSGFPSSATTTSLLHYSKSSKSPFHSPTNHGRVFCRSQFAAENDLKFVLHDALDSSGVDTTHSRAARDGFCSQIKYLSDIERHTSISINRGVNLGKTALYIAAEDDSLISHSSVPLPVEAFIERFDELTLDYCSQYHSSFRSSPEKFLHSIERYMYLDKGFKRTNVRTQSEPRTLYLHSVLTQRSGSASMLSLIYSEILKMLRLWGLLNFDAEIFFPHDLHSLPRGYHKQKSKESDQAHIMTSQSLLVKILENLKEAFWPFHFDHAKSLFLRAADAAICSDKPNNVEKSAWELASAKAAEHRLGPGVWTAVHFGDMRRALSACERLILLETDPKELRDYSILLYHCGFYEESLQYLKLYHDIKQDSTEQKLRSHPVNDEEEVAVEKLMIRLNLILMEDGWSGTERVKRSIFNNSEPW